MQRMHIHAAVHDFCVLLQAALRLQITALQQRLDLAGDNLYNAEQRAEDLATQVSCLLITSLGLPLLLVGFSIGKLLPLMCHVMLCGVLASCYTRLSWIKLQLCQNRF